MIEDEDPPASATSAPLSTPSWLWRSEALTGTSFLAMLRRLPALLGAGRRYAELFDLQASGYR